MLAGALNAPGVLLLTSALVTIAIAIQTLSIPVFAGRGAMAAALLSAAGWSFGAAMDTFPFSTEAKVIWAGLAWVPILSLSGFLLLFTWQYVRGEQRPVPRIWLVPHWGMVLLTAGIALTNPHHHLMYLSFNPLRPGGPTDFVHGPWFFVAVTYGYVLMLLAFATVVEAISRSRGVHRRQYIGIALAMVLPWLANLWNALNLYLPLGVDPTPISFLVACAIIAFLVRRERLFTLLPVARAVLVEAIPDPVLVIDLRHEVVDANAAAFALIGLSERVIGRPLAEIEPLAPLHGMVRGEGVPAEIALGADDRQFETTLVPLTHGGRQVGQMLLLRDITRRVRLEVKLREEATRDALTGLHNRRLLDEIGGQLIAEADQRVQPLAVIMVDLDYFKRLNDHHGHQAGDRVLMAVGRFLTERVRQSDFVFRTGGEEILLLLPGAVGSQALARIDGWRRDFAATAIDIGQGRVQSTFSAGVALYPRDGASLDEVMARADKALYYAKQKGRNRACLWGDMEDVSHG
jgi:diguanylate cyclase (GGDEF)-like protein